MDKFDVYQHCVEGPTLIIFIYISSKPQCSSKALFARGTEVEHASAGRTGSSHLSVLEANLEITNCSGARPHLDPALDPAPFPGTSALHLIFSLPSFFLSFLSVLGSCTDHPGEFGDLGMGTQHAETCHPQAPLFQLLAHTSSAVLADCSPGRVFHGYLSGGSTK